MSPQALLAIVLAAVPAIVSALYPLHIGIARRRARRDAGPERLPSLSTLIPVAGEEPSLRAHLVAAARQRWPGFHEVIVAGESDSDPAMRVAREVARLHPCVRVVVSGPAGEEPGKVHNLAAAEAIARGDWLVLLDSDAHLADPDDLQRYVPALADSRVGLLTRLPAHRDARGWTAVLAHLIQTDLAGLFSIEAVWGRLGLACGACLAIRRSTLAGCGGWTPLRGRLLLDTALARLVRHAGLRVELGAEAIEVASDPRGVSPVLEQSHRWHAALSRGISPLAFAGFAWLRTGAALALALALFAGSPVVRTAALAALLTRLVAALLVERLVVRSRRPLAMLLALPVAEIAAGFLWIVPALDPRIRWRGRSHRLEDGARVRSGSVESPGRLSRFVRRVRLRDWIVQLPLVVVPAAVYAFTTVANARDFWISCAWVIAIQTPLVMAGYVVNDLCDARADREKRGGALPSPRERRAQWALAAVATLAGLALSMALPPAPRLAIWAMTLAGFAYSLPGIRLKERGALGLFAAASLQRLPAFALVIPWPLRDPALAILLGFWLLGIGLVFILEHQVADVDADRRAGVCTWTARARPRPRRNVARSRRGAGARDRRDRRRAHGADPSGGMAARDLVPRVRAPGPRCDPAPQRGHPRAAAPAQGSTAQKPVRVYGGGLAGLVAAIKMAEWGRRVELFEQRLRPGGMAEERPFVHSTRQDPRALERWLDLPLAEAFDRVERKTAWINGHRVEPGGSHWSCLRGGEAGALDRLLLDRAIAAGVTIHHGRPFRPGIEANGETAVVATGHQPRRVRSAGTSLGAARSVVRGAAVGRRAAAALLPRRLDAGRLWLCRRHAWRPLRHGVRARRASARRAAAIPGRTRAPKG